MYFNQSKVQQCFSIWEENKNSIKARDFYFQLIFRRWMLCARNAFQTLVRRRPFFSFTAPPRRLSCKFARLSMNPLHQVYTALLRFPTCFGAL